MKVWRDSRTIIGARSSIRLARSPCARRKSPTGDTPSPKLSTTGASKRRLVSSPIRPPSMGSASSSSAPSVPDSAGASISGSIAGDVFSAGRTPESSRTGGTDDRRPGSMSTTSRAVSK